MADPSAEQLEARFDEVRRRVGAVLAPAAFVGLLTVPLPLDPAAHRLAAVLGLVVVLWITEAIPLAAAALLGPSLAVLLGVARAREAFAPFADPVIFLFLGSFLLAEALRVHGLDRRIALFVLSLPGVAASTWRVRAAVAAVTAGMSWWISNTATAAMMLPIVLGIVRALAAAGAREPPRALLLLVGIAASLGGIATPVGTPPNLIALGFLERQGGTALGFLTFMAVGVPLSLALLAATAAVVARLVPADPVRADLGPHLREERAALGPRTAGQRACVVAFALAVVLWLLPGVVAAARLPADALLARLTAPLEEAVVAVLAALLLFAWPLPGGGRALSWSDARNVDWGTLLLFGGGLSLGKLMFDTGLAGSLGRAAVAATGVQSLWALTALVLAVTIVLTETASNTATVSMLAPLALSLARDLQVSPVPPVLAVAFGASMGFMFPVGTPPNAVVYGTGLVPLAAMMKVGIVVDVMAFFIILAGLRILCPLLGLA